MELNELIPEGSTIIKTIKGEGETRELELEFRPFDLDDQTWLDAAFGEELESLFQKMEMNAIGRIAFHQLTPESKRNLMKIQFMDVDEDGKDIEIAKTGHAKLRKLTVGYPEQMELLTILLKTRGFSMPIIEELSNHVTGEMGNALKSKSKKKTKKKAPRKK